ncbi:MAG TPA: Gfo/Idh/MocA family oxidoreductase [Chitinivibrionales bacterium]|jgi:predicted dehydrogenase|nr:Gfo/Idh/MocA family oxidoreductase [Chitinivibrionales bacterium]
MANVKIGVIGAGVLGSYHIQKCLKNKDVECAGFHDSSAGRRAEVAKKLGARPWDDMDNLVSACDACIVATPSSTHTSVALACMEKKKHVLVEKPLAPSFAEGKALVAAAQEHGVVLHVGHSEAFNSSFVKLLSLGPLPRFIEIHRLAQYSPRGTDVPVILDLMVHDVHLVLRLLSEEPRYDAIAATGVPVVSQDIDIANVRIPFPSGCVVNCTASRISAKKMRKLRLFARDNYYSVDLDKEEIEHYFLTGAAQPGRRLPVEFSKDKTKHVDALEAELAAFVAAIQGAPDHKAVSGEEALKVLKVTDTIMGLLKNQ